MLTAALLAACGGGGTSTDPDGGTPDAAAPPDAMDFAACAEFGAPEAVESSLPITAAGNLAGAGADIEAPNDCDVIDAPFGMSSSGTDLVYELDGLFQNTDYVVRLDSDDDLAFYVVSGCSTETGPSSGQCRLFQDAETDQPEVGRFHTGDGETRAYVVVDYYAAGAPAATGFTLQAYVAECETSAECGGTTPHCQDGRCSGCASDFDCGDADLPLCDTQTYSCVAGSNSCVGDDGAENGDDGPAGATTLTPGTPRTGAICDAPSSEVDFYRFHVGTDGEDWSVQLDWSSAVDLDLEIYDATGRMVGLSLYEHPERIDLTYLPAGDYYAEVNYFTQSGTTIARTYTISAASAPDACTGINDCAAEFRNQVFRGTCSGGACRRIDGGGAVAPGGRCDSNSDCAGGADCASFFFVADADTRMTCGNLCDVDSQCAALGASYLCTDYLVDNFCVQKCTSDDQCPTVPSSSPSVPPWLRFQCQVATGRCIPP